eukprot:CAMPEP_0173345216 /NCGR_PEP_ID=MMETSP1144-20121109/11850_1 /TAXON_ID=483371 /ORGANISM="non described non described, Strain CCMP2298" /LENGTH=124 /DNA_ID=CAMNT_0014292317 /DNA_START=956 /DNA_END=1331 /DNA_ORIENTATION=+
MILKSLSYMCPVASENTCTVSSTSATCPPAPVLKREERELQKEPPFFLPCICAERPPFPFTATDTSALEPSPVSASAQPRPAAPSPSAAAAALSAPFPAAAPQSPPLSRSPADYASPAQAASAR